MGQAKVNYPAFAEFLSGNQDVFITKRFRELQIRNLLFYQAELAHLQQELAKIEDKDKTGAITSTWKPEMAEGYVPGPVSTLTTLYSNKMIRIRDTLEKYNNAVEQYRRLDEIPKPHSQDIKTVCHWLNSPLLGKGFIYGYVEDVWNKMLPSGGDAPETPEDFYSLTDQDGLAYSIGRMFAFILRWTWWKSDTTTAHHIDTTTSGGIGQALMTMIASALPVLPIIAFYFVERLSVRIGLIGMFTVVFAAILVIGLQMKPDKALAITTAIEAIQVVYVGGTSNGTSS